MLIQHCLRVSLLIALSLVLANCGGGEEQIAQISTDRPYEALPSKALMLFGASPQEIAANPLIMQLRRGFGQQNEDLMFTSAAREVGLDPNTSEVKRLCWALYSLERGRPSWGMVVFGEFQEEAVVKSLEQSADERIAVEVQKKSYSNAPYYTVKRSAQGAEASVYVMFVAPGQMIASNNEAVLRSSIALRTGKVDSAAQDKNLAPILQNVDTKAPMWVAGQASGTLEQLTLSVGYRGESLGRGVQNYSGSLSLGTDKVSLNAVLQCDNATAASRQTQNYDAIKLAYGRSYAQLYGQAAVELANQIELQAQDAEVHVSIEMDAQEVQKIAQEAEKALSAGPSQIPELLRQRLMGATRPATGAPATEPATAPVE